jgi:hypothetical protein
MPLLLMACAAANSVHFAWPGPGDSQTISVDAKLRNTVIVKDENGKYRFCSEDGPAAMTAGSFSIAGLLGLSPSQRDVSLAQGSGETVASLEHTQTVNLMHKALYRTCELWASGALKQDEFYALAARTHRSMVAVLAVEQMTGVVRPKSTIISGPAVSAAVSQTQELVKLLQGYKDERTAAKSAWDAAIKAHVDANVDVTTNGVTKKACELTTEPPEDAAKAAYNKCVSTKSAQEQAKTAHQAAEKREDSVLGQLAALSAGIGGGVESGDHDEGGLDYNGQRISDVKMALIAQSVEKIALTAGIDEALMFCTTYLRRDHSAVADTTRAMCNTVIALRASQDTRNAADIVGTESAEIADVMNFANDPMVMAEGKVTAASYEVFRLGLLALMARTPDEQWQDRWAAFANSTGVTVLECTSRTACQAHFANRNISPALTNFRKNIKGFGDALAGWRDALKESVENRTAEEEETR